MTVVDLGIHLDAMVRASATTPATLTGDARRRRELLAAERTAWVWR